MNSQGLTRGKNSDYLQQGTVSHEPKFLQEQESIMESAYKGIKTGSDMSLETGWGCWAWGRLWEQKNAGHGVIGQGGTAKSEGE